MSQLGKGERPAIPEQDVEKQTPSRDVVRTRSHVGCEMNEGLRGSPGLVQPYGLAQVKTLPRLFHPPLLGTRHARSVDGKLSDQNKHSE